MDKTWTHDAGRPAAPAPAGYSPAAIGPAVTGDRHRICPGLQVQQLPGALLIRHAKPRRTTTALFYAATGLLFAALAVWLPAEIPPHWLFPLVFEIFAATLLAVACYLPFASAELRVDRRGIALTRRWCGRAVVSRSLQRDRLKSLQIRPVDGFQGFARHGYQLLASGDFGRLSLLELAEDRALLSTVQQQILLAAGISRERLAD